MDTRLKLCMNLESFSSLCDCSAVSVYMQHACNVLLNMHETCILHACLPVNTLTSSHQ